jgi:hypothetical protein
MGPETSPGASADGAPAARPPAYTTYLTWSELKAAKGAQFPPIVRISDPGTAARPVYTGFWFFGVLQFDPTGRYALGMKVTFQNREVRPEDRGEVGYFDLRNGNAWTRIGETGAWNWQQGCRLQWRPNASEIMWNDRADDGRSFVTRVYHFEKRTTRTLPRPIYDPSPDGKVALTHDFERMTHGGTSYVGLPDRWAGRRAPAETGIWKMDLDTGRAELITSLAALAKAAFPSGYTGATDLYVFREGWNPSGTRFLAFLKNSSGYTTGWSISSDGKDIRFFYDQPSHHVWRDDQTVLEGRYVRVFRDDGSGSAVDRLNDVDANIDPTFVPGTGNQWIVGDTYPLDGIQHLFLIHVPTRRLVPLARLRSTAQPGIHRIDLHARTSPDGRIVSFDASHEGLGRQLYMIDIGHILDNPPR